MNSGHCTVKKKKTCEELLFSGFVSVCKHTTEEKMIYMEGRWRDRNRAWSLRRSYITRVFRFASGHAEITTVELVWLESQHKLTLFGLKTRTEVWLKLLTDFLAKTIFFSTCGKVSKRPRANLHLEFIKLLDSLCIYTLYMEISACVA